MQGFWKLAAGLSAAMAIGAGHAQAATWVLDYTATNGANPAGATLTVDISDIANPGGGFNVTGVSGNVDGDAITGLIANPTPGSASYSADGWFIFDNVFSPTAAPVLSNPGLFFTGASGDEYNLFSDNAATYELYDARAGVGYVSHSVGTLTDHVAPPPIGGFGDGLTTAVPEPAAWTLMIVGFGGIGAILRRRRTQPALA